MTSDLVCSVLLLIKKIDIIEKRLCWTIAGAEGSNKTDESFKFDKESSLIVDMLLEDEDCDEETNAKLQDYITGELDQVFSKKTYANKPFFQFMNPTNNNKGWSSGFGNYQPSHPFGGIGFGGNIGSTFGGGASAGYGTVNWGGPQTQEFG